MSPKAFLEQPVPLGSLPLYQPTPSQVALDTVSSAFPSGLSQTLRKKKKERKKEKICYHLFRWRLPFPALALHIN